MATSSQRVREGQPKHANAQQVHSDSAVVRAFSVPSKAEKEPRAADAKKAKEEKEDEEARTAKLAARLKSLRVEDVPSVPNLGVPTLGRIKAVHDADTITVIICLGRCPLCVRVRIQHIDAPEVSLRGGTTPLEKEAGLKVKEYVAKLLTNGESVALAKVVLTGIDKYGGRYLGDIFLSDGTLLSEHLLSHRFVRRYEGERKTPWDVGTLNAIVAAVSSS